MRWLVQFARPMKQQLQNNGTRNSPGKWAFSLLYDVFFVHFVPLLLGIDFWIFLGGGCLAIEFAPCLAAQGR